MWFQFLEWLHNGNSLLKWTTFFPVFFLNLFFSCSRLSKTKMNLSWDKIVCMSFFLMTWKEFYAKMCKGCENARLNSSSIWLQKCIWIVSSVIWIDGRYLGRFNHLRFFFRPKNSLKPNDRSQINEQNHLMFLKISPFLRKQNIYLYFSSEKERKSEKKRRNLVSI